MPAALISQMDPPPGERDAFERWYSEEHVPLRMELPGFRSAARGWAVEGEPSHLVIYWMDEPGALATPQYRAVKERPSAVTRHMLENVAAFTRWLGPEISDTGAAEPGRFLYLVTFDVPEDSQPAFDDWYERDHVPLLMRNQDWLRVRRYAIVDGEPPGVTRAAVHELRSLEALSSPEREAARTTDWRARLAENAWFASVRYAVYERHQDFEATHGR